MTTTTFIPWTTAERKILRRVYPIGGSAACVPLIPRHGVKAIQRQAAEMQVRAPVPTTSKPANVVPDAARDTILQAVRSGLRSGDYVRLSEMTGVPPWTVKKFALRLAKQHGLEAPQCGARPWTDAIELEVLTAASHMPLDDIVRALAARGYMRSRTAVRNRLRILGVTRDVSDHMSAKELAHRLGFDDGLIRRDIAAGRLHAVPRPGVLRPEMRRGPTRWWWISDRSVQQWLLADTRRLTKALRQTPPEWRLWLDDLLGKLPSVEQARKAVNGMDTAGVPAHWMVAA